MKALGFIAAPRRLHVVAVEELADQADAFECSPLHARIPARVCLARQQLAQRVATAEIGREEQFQGAYGHCRVCLGCPLGATVAHRLGLGPAPTPPPVKPARPSSAPLAEAQRRACRPGAAQRIRELLATPAGREMTVRQLAQAAATSTTTAHAIRRALISAGVVAIEQSRG